MNYYTYISIKTQNDKLFINADYHYYIYEFLIKNGYSHDDAASVASWAEVASIDEEYELDGAEIKIIKIC